MAGACLYGICMFSLWLDLFSASPKSSHSPKRCNPLSSNSDLLLAVSVTFVVLIRVNSAEDFGHQDYNQWERNDLWK